MCARVALTACARSSLESISVPSRSKMTKSMLGLNSKRSANSPWVTGSQGSDMSYSSVRTCAACGAKNRIPAKHLSDAGRCGSCKETLPPLAAPIEVDTERLRRDHTRSQGSGARRLLGLVVWTVPDGRSRSGSTPKETPGRAIVLKVDTERHPDLAARYRVQGIPNFVVLRGGQTVLQQAGLVPRAQMRRWIEDAA